MKKTGMKYAALSLAAAALLALGGVISDAAATEDAMNAITRQVERSALSEDAKSALLRKAGEAVNAGIPVDDLEIIITRGISRGADSATLIEYLGLALSVKTRGLPMRPVLDRIQQGLSKGAPATKIIASSRHL